LTISVGRGLADKHSAAALAAGLFEALGRNHRAPGVKRAAWLSILATMIHELLDAERAG